MKFDRDFVLYVDELKEKNPRITRIDIIFELIIKEYGELDEKVMEDLCAFILSDDVLVYKIKDEYVHLNFFKGKCKTKTLY